LTVTVLDGDPTVVTLAGELDLASLPRLSAALAPCSRDIEVHCAGLTFFGVVGVHALIAAHDACAERGSKLVVVNPSRPMLRVLTLANVDTVLNIRQGGIPL
jgi:anti-anti-sigma factor